MYSKNDNIAFRQELQNFKKNGIVVMRIKGFVMQVDIQLYGMGKSLQMEQII